MALFTTFGWAIVLLLVFTGWGRIGQRFLQLDIGFFAQFWLGFTIISTATFLFYAGHMAYPVPLFALAGLIGWVGTNITKPNFKNLKLPLLFASGFALLHLFSASLPPVEADSLAYHFALPKQFVEAQALIFQSMAVDYAVPFLTQSSWITSYALGGERAMMALAWLSALMAAGMVYQLGRVWLPTAWAAWTAIVVLALPIFSYGFAAGTVELRLVGVVALAIFALLKHQQFQGKWWVVAAIAAGAMLGMKLFSLFSAFLIGLSYLYLNRRQPLWQQAKHAISFAAVITLVAAPFYIWLWLNSGSPIFPIGCGSIFNCPNWSTAQNSVFSTFMDGTRAGYGQSLWHFMYYPIEATLNGTPYDNSRTGLGHLLPLGMLAAVVSLWHYRPQNWADDAQPAWLGSIIFVGFFALWFFLGASSKTRHLLPVFPLTLLAGSTLVYQAWHSAPKLAQHSQQLFMLATLGLFGLAALAINLPALKAVLTNQTPQAYQQAQINTLGTLKLLDLVEHKNPKIFTHNLRQLNYNMPLPYGYHYPYYQSQIGLMTDTPKAVWQQLQQQGYTHWLLKVPQGNRHDAQTFHTLRNTGCLTPVAEQQLQRFSSRTLKTNNGTATYQLLRISPLCNL